MVGIGFPIPSSLGLRDARPQFEPLKAQLAMIPSIALSLTATNVVPWR
jgi:hypothetical protein